MKNKGAKQKTKRKGAKEGAFGCDLTEYLQNTGQDVPQVLKSCAGFIEKNGIVDGVYRLSGITSNIQKLRQEFGTEQCPDLTKEVYLQDIHCVGSLCKQYFRELPNPLLTYELYKKFTEAVSAQSEEEQILRVHNVIKELPSPHYRTLEYLTKHLTHIASYSCETNMHSRNLALVWAPNLLRSKEIEGSGYNNDAAFLEVRIQSVVIEFILNHVNQLFNNSTKQPGQENEVHNPISICKSLPVVSPSMKLLTLEEAQARTLGPDHPARLEKLHCAPMDTGPAAGTIYHTVIDLPDPRRKLSAKAKKWKSIFNLGRSGADSKGKLSRNSSVFVRGRKLSEKASIRPAKSMDSLCSLPAEDDKHGATLGGGLSPAMKSHTLGSGGSFHLGRRHSDWDQEDLLGAIGGCASNTSKETTAKEMLPLKLQPEPLKVIRGDALNKSEPTSPKTRRLFYSTNLNEVSMKSNFPGNLFPLEASPRHHRKPIAVNISEPYSVSVPLHISGIISPGSTLCKEPQKSGPDLNIAALQDSSFTVNQHESNNLSPAKHEKVAKEPLNQPFPNPFSSRAEMKGDQTIENQELLESRPIDVSSKPASFNLPTLFPNVTIQQSEPLQLVSPASSVSSSNLPDTENQEGQALPSPLTEIPCENCNHQTASEDSNKDQPATKQDQEVNKSTAKAFMEQLWPDTKEELKITEPETATTANFQEKVEKSLVQTYDKNEIKEKSLPHASPDLPCTGPQKKHSSNQFLQSSCMSVVTETNKDTCPTCAHHIPSTEESIASDQTLSQPLPMGDLLDVSSKTELPHSTEDKNIFIESRSTMCAKPSTANSISNDSECNLGQPTDSGLIERDQRPGLSHQVETSEIWIRDDISKQSELSPKSNVNLSGMCSGDVFYIETKPAKVNLLNIKKNQKKQLPDRPSNLKSLASQTDELLTPEHWIDNDTFQQSSSHSSQWIEIKIVQEECLTEVPEKEYGFSQIVTNVSQEKEWPDPPQQILFFEDCTDKILPEDSYSSSYQSFNENIGWSKQCPETPSKVSKSECLMSTCPVMKLVTFPNEMEEATSSALNVPLNKDNAVSSKESKSASTESTGAAPCLVSVGTEPIVKNFDGIKEYCLKCEDKPLSLHSNSTKTDKHPVPHGDLVQSFPIGVTAVRTTYMIKTCQVKAVPVIPPKVQFTQVPQPLQKKCTATPFLSLDKVLTALQPSTVCESTCPENKKGPEKCQPSLPIPEPKDGKENDLPNVTKSKTSGHENHIVPSDPTVTQSQTTQAALPVIRRTCKANGEDVMGIPISSIAERSPALQKSSFLRHTQHRTRPGRPQSLILFSPPWPNMERTSSAESNKVLLSPIRSSTDQLQQLGLDHSTSGGCPNELNENQKTLEGVTLRSKMSIPKNGQRLETSTSCFYQPQRRSMIFENRGGRQIE